MTAPTRTTMATEMQLSLSAKEKALLLLTILLVPCFLTMFVGIYHVRTTNTAFHRDPANMPQLLDLWRAVLWALLIMAVRFHVAKKIEPLGNYVLAPNKRNNVDRLERFANVVFKLMFYVSITSIGFVVIREEKWFTRSLGGHGDAAAVFDLDVISVAPPNLLKQYYMLQLGYHLHSLLYVLFLTPIRNDFIEMFTHHVATIFLIAGSYLTNYLAQGALVVFTHDVGDVATYLIKALADSAHLKTITCCYFVMLLTWAHTRLYVFPSQLIYNAVVVLPTANQGVVSPVFMYPMVTMLCMLQVLHVYWYVLLIYMGYALIFKGKAEDVQQQCHNNNELVVSAKKDV